MIRKRHPHLPMIVIVVCGGLGVFACQSQLGAIDTDLSPIEFFQRAQEASDAGDYSRAVEYYQVFQEKYPEIIDRNLWSSYEIAFLYHKLGQDDRALQLFEKLLERYSQSDSQALPQGPRILAEKVKVLIENEE